MLLNQPGLKSLALMMEGGSTTPSTDSFNLQATDVLPPIRKLWLVGFSLTSMDRGVYAHMQIGVLQDLRLGFCKRLDCLLGYFIRQRVLLKRLRIEFPVWRYV